MERYQRYFLLGGIFTLLLFVEDVLTFETFDFWLIFTGLLSGVAFALWYYFDENRKHEK